MEVGRGFFYFSMLKIENLVRKYPILSNHYLDNFVYYASNSNLSARVLRFLFHVFVSNSCVTRFDQCISYQRQVYNGLIPYSIQSLTVIFSGMYLSARKRKPLLARASISSFAFLDKNMFISFIHCFVWNHL